MPMQKRPHLPAGMPGRRLIAQTRVLIADDHPLILEGLRRILEPRFAVVGAVSDGRSLVDEAERLKPDVIVLDIGMPELNGIEAARRIHKLTPKAKLIVISQQGDHQYVSSAFEAGASGYVLKQSSTSDLLAAIGEALAGRYYVSADVARTLPERPPTTGRNPGELFGGVLTPRQREVLQLVAEGKSTKEIAGVLSISIKTVEFHKSGIMDELGLRTTAELTRYAVANGIVNE